MVILVIKGQVPELLALLLKLGVIYCAQAITLDICKMNVLREVTDMLSCMKVMTRSLVFL